jgi:hypothetical protein
MILFINDDTVFLEEMPNWTGRKTTTYILHHCIYINYCFVDMVYSV